MRTLIYVLAVVFCSTAHASEAPAEKAAALVNAGSYEDAIVLYEEALSANPEDASLHLSLGLSYQAVSKLEEAIESIQKAVELSPKFAEAYYSLALLYEAVAFEAEKPEESKENLENAREAWDNVILFEKDSKKIKIARKHHADVLEQLAEL